MEVLNADPGLIEELMEVIECESVVRALADPSKLNKAQYSLLREMGYGDSDDAVPEELIGRPDERWLMQGAIIG